MYDETMDHSGHIFMCWGGIKRDEKVGQYQECEKERRGESAFQHRRICFFVVSDIT